MRASTHTHTHTRTPLEALMNLDVIGTEAELRGGEAEGDEDRWIKSRGGGCTRGRGWRRNFVFRANKMTIYALKC